MKTEVLHIRVTPQLLERMTTAAAREGITRSNLITHAIVAYLRHSDDAAWRKRQERGA